MSCAWPDLPSGTPALATSFGSIGALLPTEVGNLVQIGVSDDPRMDGVDPNPIAGRGTLHRHRFREQAQGSLRSAIAGQTCRPAEACNRRHDNDGAVAGAQPAVLSTLPPQCGSEVNCDRVSTRTGPQTWLSRSWGDTREDTSMLEIGLFHNGASSLPVITTKDGVTFNDGSLPEVHR